MSQPWSAAWQTCAVATILTFLLASANAATVHMSGTSTTLLSESLTSCTDPTSSGCRGGLSSALAVLRDRIVNHGESHVFLPELDRQAPFVQMHPLGQGVNFKMFQDLGISYASVRPSFFGVNDRNTEPLVNTSVRPVIANVNVPPTDALVNLRRTFFVDTATRVAVVATGDSFQPNSVDIVESVAWAIVDARRDPRTQLVVVLFADETPVAGFISRLRARVQQDPFGRMTMPDVVLEENEERTAGSVFNGTWLSSIDRGSRVVSAVRIDYTPAAAAGVPPTVQNVSGTANYGIRPVDDSLKDAAYYTHMAYAQSLADVAAANDPVIGTASEAMPFVRDGELRMCKAGECPLGNLWTDVYRWKGNDEVAFTGSGGVRGPGWPIGDIKVSDIWNTLPFANTLCRGRLAGVTIWEMLNASLALATFEGMDTPTGGDLLQISGLRVRFSLPLGVGGWNARLLSIEVLDRSTGTYSPLERLRLYSFASDSFFCGFFSPFNGFVQRRQYPGEEFTVGDDLVQALFAEYLTANSPYAPIRNERYINDTAATLAQADAYDLVQTQAACPANTYWDPPYFTCRECREGFDAPAGGATRCDPIPEKDTTTRVVVAVVVPILTISAFFIILFLIRRQRALAAGQRNVANAPKEGRITLMFTDIEDSTKLWSTCPMSMSVALDTHHQIIRSVLDRHRGYEVKTAGDSFMIAAPTEDAAIRISMDIQRELLAASYPAAINEVYAANNEDELFAIDDNPDTIGQPTSDAWHGLRVRIGFHSGEPSVTFDEVTKGYDYYGPPVNVAARTEQVTKGGQVCATAQTVQHASTMQDVTMRDLGTFDMKGVAEPVLVVEVSPAELSEGRLSRFQEGATTENVFVDDAATSVLDESDAEGELADYALFTGALFRVMRPKERETTVKKITGAWRIDTRDKDQDAVHFDLAKRVFHAVERERRRIERAALEGSDKSQRHGTKLNISAAKYAKHSPGQKGLGGSFRGGRRTSTNDQQQGLGDNFRGALSGSFRGPQGSTLKPVAGDGLGSSGRGRPDMRDPDGDSPAPPGAVDPGTGAP